MISRNGALHEHHAGMSSSAARSANRALSIGAVDQDTVFIGRQITGAWDKVYPAILAGVRKGGFCGRRGHTAIVPTSLGAQPYPLGAAAISYSKLFATTTS
jgi:hypothetical protein